MPGGMRLPETDVDDVSATNHYCHWHSVILIMPMVALGPIGGVETVVRALLEIASTGSLPGICQQMLRPRPVTGPHGIYIYGYTTSTQAEQALVLSACNLREERAG